MQLPDEAITYQYQSLLVPPAPEWTPTAELRTRHFLAAGRLRDLAQRLMQVRSQVAAERDLQQVPAEQQPLQAGWIDLPQKLLDQHRRQQDMSDLGRILQQANKLKNLAGTIVVLGIGGSYLGSRALFEALKSSYHNDLPDENRIGVPRVYFAGHSLDTDALQDLLEMIETTCVDPELREERWGVIAISKSGDTLETAAAYRVFRRNAAEYYGPRSEHLQELFVPVTGSSGKLRDLWKATFPDTADADILSIP